MQKPSSSKMQELQRLLLTFRIPESRKTDLRWLRDNVGIQNSGHRDLETVIKLVVELLKEANDTRKNDFLR